jgi:hypothetical protein
MKIGRANVLLIEGDPLYRAALARLLAATNAPYILDLAESLASGLDKLARGKVDLVLLDLELPGSRGLEAFSKVNASYGDVPIIVLSSQDDDEIATSAVEAGAQDYLVKAKTSGQLLRRAMRYAIERHRSESALRESQRLLQEIADSTPEIPSLFNVDENRMVYVNRQITNLLGYTSAALENLDLSELIHPDDFPLLKERLRTLGAGSEGGVAEIAYRVRHADGEWRWLRSESLVFTREPLQILSTTQDITERKLAEETIRRNEERYREQAALLDCAQDAIVARDLEGRILFWNRSAQRIFGRRSDQGTAEGPPDRLTPIPSLQIAEAEKKVLEKGEWTGEVRHETEDGREIIFESRWTLVRRDDGAPKSILVINTDVTEKKRLEAQFLRMQRLESIGSLAGGIAHDLNNSLAPILMALHTLQQRFTDANSRRWLSLIHKSTERSRDLIDKVLTFAKGAEGERAPLQTPQLINDVVKILNETLPKNVTLVVRLPGDLWNLIGDTTQIHQVLMNLCINARDAMAGGGVLTITAENVEIAEKQVWMTNEVAPGRFTLITVADTGIGMSPELIDRAFEPFFTTKPQGQGSGLGLSTSAGIVRSHGGFIAVASAPGKGSVFKVYLPALEASADCPPDSGEVFIPSGPSGPSGKNELILVVEDEAEFREVTQATLEANGYRTIGAGDGRNALELFERHRDEIALVLTDLALPYLDGMAMSRALHKINPQVKIIGACGVSSAGNAEEFRRAGIKTVLNKPFTAVQLLKSMATALNE